MNSLTLRFVHHAGAWKVKGAPAKSVNLAKKEFFMAGNPRQIFRGITRAIFARLRQRASKVGILVASPQEKP